MNIVHIKEGFHIAKKSKEQDYCRHKNVDVCESTRTIECRECKITMDAFDYLFHCAIQSENAFEAMNNYKVEVDRLQRRYDNLNKEIERLTKIKNTLKK